MHTKYGYWGNYRKAQKYSSSLVLGTLFKQWQRHVCATLKAKTKNKQRKKYKRMNETKEKTEQKRNVRNK
jgi:hypothetical protein